MDTASVIIIVCACLVFLDCIPGILCPYHRRNLQQRSAQSRNRTTRDGNMVVLAGAGAVVAGAAAVSANDSTDHERKRAEVTIDLGASAEATVMATQGCCCGGGGCGGDGGSCGGCGGD
uniref:Chorion class high-cysteine HCB protein 13-like n=1 Tax=Nicotiana tabacum TaxID=4097 RepID=A0A1S3ZJ32_TOBAC|nr:PREDICTED: uncharacterized protein LOC107787266 [Nicotiana tabacum]